MPKLSELSSVSILTLLKDKKISGGDLPPDVRLTIVQILRQTYTQAEIAELLHLCDRTIERDVKKLKDESVKLVADISIDKMAGGLIRAASYLTVRAQKAKNLSLAWRIQCELIDKLQSMGYIHVEPKEIKVKAEAGPGLIKLLGEKNGDDGRTFGESWRDRYRSLEHADPN